VPNSSTALAGRALTRPVEDASRSAWMRARRSAPVSVGLLARTGLETRFLLVLLGQLAAGQQRIDALDRRDDDRGVLVEPGGPEPLDVVELGERSARAGRAKILELVPGLADEVGAIGEEQNPPETSRARAVDG
jgi:hypothetical protein